MKNGFTLVELSIVLVIIGLLVGGILVAQSLIDTAKIQNLVRYMSQVDIAQLQFKDKYKCLAGDCLANFTPNGDGDGKLEPQSWSSGNMNIYAENRAFWKNLSEAGFQPDGVVYSDAYTTNNNMTLGVHGPEVDGYEDVSIFVSFTPGGETRDNFYLVSGISDISSGIQDGPFTAADAIAFDQKLDDGHPVLGIVATSGAATDCVAGYGPVPPYSLNMSSQTTGCSLYIGFDFNQNNYNVLTDTLITSLGHTP